MSTSTNLKRKRQDEPDPSQQILEPVVGSIKENSQQEPELSRLEQYLTNKKSKLNTYKKPFPQEKPITISIRQQPKFERGFFNLPKDVIVEALHVKNISLKLTSSKGNQGSYYRCQMPDCTYRLKLEENEDKVKILTLSSLITNFKNIDISQNSELTEGICFATEYGEHCNLPQEVDDAVSKKYKSGMMIFI